MEPLTLIMAFLLILNSVGLVVLGIVILNHILQPEPEKTGDVEEFMGCLQIINAIIQTELEAYENDIFQHKGSITNSNFDNYYKDICDKIIKKLQPKFVDHLTTFYSEEGVYGMVARKVKVYLAGKINGTM